jgi:hypothetical protein
MSHERDFIITKEHRRFTEFANAVRKERTIGICHGDAGVGKTQSGRRYAHWDSIEPFITDWGSRTDKTPSITPPRRSRTLFYTPPVLPKPAQLIREIDHMQTRLGSASTNTYGRREGHRSRRAFRPAQERGAAHHRRSRTAQRHNP